MKYNSKNILENDSINERIYNDFEKNFISKMQENF